CSPSENAPYSSPLIYVDFRSLRLFIAFTLPLAVFGRRELCPGSEVDLRHCRLSFRYPPPHHCKTLDVEGSPHSRQFSQPHKDKSSGLTPNTAVPGRKLSSPCSTNRVLFSGQQRIIL